MAFLGIGGKPAASAPPAQQASTDPAANNGGTNLPGNSGEIPKDLWNPQTQQTQTPANNGGQQPANNGGGAPTDGKNVFDEYANGLQFGQNAMTPEIMQKFQSGDFSDLPTVMAQAGREAYKQAVIDTNKLINARVEAAVTTAVEKANTSRHTDAHISDMHSALPFTSDELISPVAISVLGKFLARGQSKKEAIENVGKYFQHVGTQAGGNSGRPGTNGPGRANNPGSGPSGGDIDWASFMTEGNAE